MKFDADYKRVKREKQVKKEAGFFYYSMELLETEDGDSCIFEVPDPDMDVEQMVIHKMDLEKLKTILEMLSNEERHFILDCFDGEWGAGKKIAEKYGMTIGAVKQKKRRIMRKITMLFQKADSAIK